jgi:hypothetical protein
MTAPDSAELGADWSPSEHVPADEVLQRLLDTTERRWSAERFGGDSDVQVITDWLWNDALHTDEVEVVRVIEAANSLAYSLGRKRPVVLIPHAAHPTVDYFVAPVHPELPGGIMMLGVGPVREAIRAGAGTVDELLADRHVREGLDHESRRFCYRGWLAGDGRRKPETEDTRRAMAAFLLEVLTTRR